MDDDYLHSDEIWSALTSGMTVGRWYDLQELYVVVAERAVLSPADLDPAAAGSQSLRWHRNVRNVLQRRKSVDDIEWNGNGKYRLH